MYYAFNSIYKFPTFYWLYLQVERNLRAEINGLDILEFAVDKWPDFSVVTLMPKEDAVSIKSCLIRPLFIIKYLTEHSFVSVLKFIYTPDISPVSREFVLRFQRSQWRIQGGQRGHMPPKITPECDKAQATLRNWSKSVELYITQKWQTTLLKQ